MICRRFLAAVVLGPALALTSATSASGQHGAAVTIGPGGDPGSASGSGPVQRIRTRIDGGAEEGVGRASTTASSVYGFAEAWYLGSASLEFNTTCRSTRIWTDVVFSAPTSTTISVSMNLSISGAGAGSYPAVSIGVTGGHPPSSGVQDRWDSLNGGQGLLAGYDGVGPYDITTLNFSVPTNTPVTINMVMNTIANANGRNNSSWNIQRMSLGSTLGGGPVFNVPAGVTVDSVQAGVVNNGVAADPNLYLGSDPTTVMPGDPLNLVTWNGHPTRPVLLFVTSVNGMPTALATPIGGLIDADGRFEVNVAAVPANVTGVLVDFLMYSLDGSGKLITSNTHAINFQ